MAENHSSPGVYLRRKSEMSLPFLDTTNSDGRNRTFTDAVMGKKYNSSAWQSENPRYMSPSAIRRESLVKENARLSVSQMREQQVSTGADGPSLNLSEKEHIEVQTHREKALSFAMRATVAERALKTLQMEVDELKRKDIKNRQQKEELRSVNKKLRQELEAIGETVLEQTKTLKILSNEIQRLNPCQLVKAKRNDRGSIVVVAQGEPEASVPDSPSSSVAQIAEYRKKIEELERLVRKHEDTSLRRSSEVVPPLIEKEDSTEAAVLLLQLAKIEEQNAELLTLVGALDAEYTGAPQRSFEPDLVYAVELSVLSCSLENKDAFIVDHQSMLRPYVVVNGPYKEDHVLLTTNPPRNPTLHPRYDDQAEVARWVCLKRSKASFIVLNVLSLLQSDTVSLGKADISVGTLLQTTLRGIQSPRRYNSYECASLHNLPVRNLKGEQVGSVCVEVKARQRNSNVIEEKTLTAGAVGKPHLIAANNKKYLNNFLFRGSGAANMDEPKKKTIDFFIQIMEAASLLERSPGVASNPYVVVSDTTTGKEIFRTCTCEGNSFDPKWDAAHVVYEMEKFKTSDSDPLSKGDFVFQVFDALGGPAEEDDFLGEGRLHKYELLSSPIPKEIKLTLQPRFAEPVPYITKYKGALGTVTVRLCNLSKTAPDAQSRCPSVSPNAPALAIASPSPAEELVTVTPPPLPPSPPPPPVVITAPNSAKPNPEAHSIITPPLPPRPITPPVVSEEETPAPAVIVPLSSVPLPPVPVPVPTPEPAHVLAPVPVPVLTTIPVLTADAGERNIKIQIKEARNFSLLDEDDQEIEALKHINPSGPLEIEIVINDGNSRGGRVRTPPSMENYKWNVDTSEFKFKLEEKDSVQFVLWMEDTMVGEVSTDGELLLSANGEKRLPIFRGEDGCGRLIIDIELLEDP